jgi:hypothetical protein
MPNLPLGGTGVGVTGAGTGGGGVGIGVRGLLGVGGTAGFYVSPRLKF